MENTTAQPIDHICEVVGDFVTEVTEQVQPWDFSHELSFRDGALLVSVAGRGFDCIVMATTVHGSCTQYLDRCDDIADAVERAVTEVAA